MTKLKDLDLRLVALVRIGEEDKDLDELHQVRVGFAYFYLEDQFGIVPEIAHDELNVELNIEDLEVIVHAHLFHHFKLLEDLALLSFQAPAVAVLIVAVVCVGLQEYDAGDEDLRPFQIKLAIRVAREHTYLLEIELLRQAEEMDEILLIIVGELLCLKLLVLVVLALDFETAALGLLHDGGGGHATLQLGVLALALQSVSHDVLDLAIELDYE